jgi:hypothetical protein
MDETEWTVAVDSLVVGEGEGKTKRVMGARLDLAALCVEKTQGVVSQAS